MPFSISSTYTRLRDHFLPEHLRPRGDELPTRKIEHRRIRRFISLLVVTSVITLVTSLMHLLQGLWLSGLGAMLALLLLLSGLEAVRRGVRVVLVSIVFLSITTMIAVGLAIATGTHGMISLFWVSLVPTIALSISSQRVAWWVFATTAALLAAALWVIYSGHVPPAIDASHTTGAHIASLTGAMGAFFALSLAYERETEASIAELERNNAALIEARRAADTASRAKGEFLATMSHEIRTPMNGVLGMTTVMLSRELPGPVREGLLTIRKSGDTLMALLNDVLDLSRIESGQLKLEKAPVDVVTEVRSVVALLETFAQERGNDLDVRVTGSIPGHVSGDPLRFRQIILNLVSNALKFTHGGRVGVALSMDGEQLRIDIEDTGIGIEASALAVLFKPFKQADASTTRRFGGTGLGLAIVHQLVTAMQGQISVTSEPGRGSRFTVHLPALPCEAPRSEPRMLALQGRPLRLLLAEDNVINRKVAVLLLQGLGHEVVAVTDGALAVEAASNHDFDLILMDCHMPTMDGFEATRKLRERGNQTPIVALTAASMPEEQQRCLDAGMAAVLLKPIQEPEVRLALTRHARGADAGLALDAV